MAITVAMRTQVSQLYVALFGRAPDGEGLGFWVGKLDTGGSLASVAQEMYNTTPARVFYPTFLTNEEIVGRFYTNVLGRTADAEGLAFWTGKLNAKGATPGSVISEMISVVQNYKGTDPAGVTSAALFNNKVSVAQAYGEANKDAAGATTAIATVTADPATVTAAIAAINAPAPVPSTTFTLTTGVDTGTSFTGGAGNDTFNASGTTLTAGDSLVGGSGTDSLNITTTAAATLGAGVATSSIENISFTATGGAVSLDASGFTGVTAVASTGSTETVTVSGMKAVPTTISATGTNKNLTVGFASTAISGTADATTVNVNGVATTADTTITVDGVESVTLNATGAASGGTASTLTLASNALRGVVLTGDATTKVAVTLSGATASATTGTITGTVTGSAGADDITITAGGSGLISSDLGAGDDTLRLSAIASGYTIAGGAGTDTLVYTGSAVTTANSANITGIEKVSLPTSSPSFALAGVTEVTYGVAAAGTLTGLASGGKVNLQAGGTLTLANTAWTTPTSDAITVVSGLGGTTGSNNLSTIITADKVETITVNVNNGTTVATTLSNTVSVTSDTVKTIVVTSPIGATLAGAGAAATSIDASGVTGAFSSTFTGATAGIAITGGAGSDTLNGGGGADTLSGGSGTDSINGGVGADVLTGGAGNDTFVIGYDSTAATNISNSVAMDTITDFTSGDRLQIAQSNTRFLGNFANVTVGLGSMTAGAQSFFVTSENTLYVVQTQGRLSPSDTMVKLTNVTSLSESDLSLGSSGATGNTVVPASATTVNAYVQAASNGASGSSTLSGFNDTMRVFDSTQRGYLAGAATLDGGNGTDTIELYGGTAGFTLSLNAGVTNFEAISIVNAIALGTATTAESTTGAMSLTVGDANVAAGLTTPFNITASGITGARVTVDASAVTSPSSTAAKSLSITGGSWSGGDSLTGGSGNDTIDGGSGNDTLDGGAGNDILIGGAGNDSITGGLGADSMTGADGNDTFVAASGSDTIDGGNGDDTVVLDTTGTYGTTSAAFSVTLGAGANTLQLNAGGQTLATNTSVTATGGTYSLNFNSGAATHTIPMAVLGTASSISSATGTQAIVFNTSGTIDVSTYDSVTAATYLEGFTMASGGGTITIGAGQTVTGAAGVDTVSINSSVGSLAGIGNMGGGADVLNVTGNTAISATLTNAVNLERIVFANTTAGVTLTTVDGNMTAAGTMTVDATALTTGALAFTGTSETGTASNFDVAGGSGADNIQGGSGADTLTGNSGNDTITGGGGNDYIDGGAGADSLDGGVGDDTIIGGAGDDIIMPGVGVDLIYLTSTAGEATSGTDRIVFAAGTAVANAPATTATAGMNQIIGLVDSSRLISSNAVLSVAGIDKIFGFGATSQIAVEGLRNAADGAANTLATTILRSGDVMSNTVDTQNQGLVRGNYDATAGTFTVSLTGTSSIWFYDADPSAGTFIRGVVLVGYVDAAANDTGATTGLTGVGG